MRLGSQWDGNLTVPRLHTGKLMQLYHHRFRMRNAGGFSAARKKQRREKEKKEKKKKE